MDLKIVPKHIACKQSHFEELMHKLGENSISLNGNNEMNFQSFAQE